jgi:hypothetical protein
MKTIQATKIKKTTESEPRNLPGSGSKKSVSPKNLVSIFIESALTGFSLFAAFIIQKSFLEFQHHQYPFGPGELLRMSAGISFCYAFIVVLRRSYLNRSRLSGKDVFRQVSRYVVETYVLFLALLFLANDISLKSISLALGSGLILSFFLLLSFRLITRSKIIERKYSERRKIVLKKSAPPVASKDRSRRDIDEKTELLIIPRENPEPQIGRIEENIDDSLQDSERYSSRHYSKNLKNQD